MYSDIFLTIAGMFLRGYNLRKNAEIYFEQLRKKTCLGLCFRFAVAAVLVHKCSSQVRRLLMRSLAEFPVGYGIDEM